MEDLPSDCDSDDDSYWYSSTDSEGYDSPVTDPEGENKYENLDEGETLVISGLISEDRSKTVDQLAGLGNIPVLGRLFQSKDFRERRSEMIVFVTPRFIQPGGGLNQQLTDRANQSLDEVQRNILQGREKR